MAKFDNVNKDAALLSGGAGWLYYIKETLKAAGWTVVASSTGLAYSAVGDVITTYAAGAGGMDNASAWFRIRDPGSLREFTFQRNASGVGLGYGWRVKYSASARFTGGSPGVTQTASATDEQVLAGSGTDAAPGYTNIPPTGTDYYSHCVAQSTPENGVYGFWCFASTKGTGGLTAIVVCEPLDSASYPSADVDPCMIAVAGNATKFTTSGTWSSWYAKGLGAQAWLANTYVPTILYQSGNALFGTAAVGANPYTGEDDNIAVAWGRSSAVAQPGWRGYSKYIKARGSLRVYPATADLATDAYVYTTDMLFPWPNGVTPSL